MMIMMTHHHHHHHNNNNKERQEKLQNWQLRSTLIHYAVKKQSLTVFQKKALMVSTQSLNLGDFCAQIHTFDHKILIQIRSFEFKFWA
jgi:hypothetical protein